MPNQPTQPYQALLRLAQGIDRSKGDAKPILDGLCELFQHVSRNDLERDAAARNSTWERFLFEFVPRHAGGLPPTVRNVVEADWAMAFREMIFGPIRRHYGWLAHQDPNARTESLIHALLEWMKRKEAPSKADPSSSHGIVSYLRTVMFRTLLKSWKRKHRASGDANLDQIALPIADQTPPSTPFDVHRSVPFLVNIFADPIDRKIVEGMCRCLTHDEQFSVRHLADLTGLNWHVVKKRLDERVLPTLRRYFRALGLEGESTDEPC
jgi:hypothetical protein